MAKRWLIGVACVPIVLVGVGVAAGLSFDPNGQKDRIAAAVQRATGRTLTLAGPIHLAWGWTPVLDAEDVSLANMPGGTRPQMATVARAEARVKLLPLLSGRFEIANVTLVRPDILLETDANGRGNWQFDRPVSAPGPAGTAAPARHDAPPLLDGLRVEAGRLTWHDGVTGRTIVADLPHATLTAGEGPAHLLADAEIAGTPVKLDATLGTAAQLIWAAPGPWPIKLGAMIGDATVALDGTVDPARREVYGRVDATVPDLQRLGVVLARPDLPPLHGLHVAATLPVGGGLPQDVALQVGASDLGSVLAGATLGHLALTWPTGQAARLDADGSLAGAPWRVASGLVPAGQGVALRGLTIASSLGDVAGDLALTATPRPAVRGTVVSNRLDVDAIRALRFGATTAPAPVAPAAPAPPAEPVASRLFSDTPLPWAVLRRADADLQVTIGTLQYGGVAYRNATGHLVLADGALRLDPASIVSPQGQVGLTVDADARPAAPPVAVVLRSAAVAIDPLLQAFGLPGGSDGTAEIDVALQATGASPHALASTLNGHAGLALVDGDLSNAVLAAALGGVMRSAGAALDPGGRSHVRCLAIRADAKEGQVTVTDFKLDTARLSIEGTGTLNLADETTALRLRPVFRFGGTGVSAPVRVDGPLRRPAVALDPAAGTGRVGVVIGGVAGPPDNCAAELASARDGRSGRLPSAEIATGKPPKTMDILKSLLR